MQVVDWFRRRFGGAAQSDQPDDVPAEEGEESTPAADEDLAENDDPTTYPLW